MPVATHQLIPANAALPGYAVAKNLALLTAQHFDAVRNTNTGIGAGSCCAAAAVAAQGDFAAAGPLPYGAAFGNSRFGTGLTVLEIGGHAERSALEAVANGGSELYQFQGLHTVLFVELQPCNPCQQWLTGQNNPYNHQFNTLNVWWHWQYPGEVQNMVAFHGATLANQLANITNQW